MSGEEGQLLIEEVAPDYDPSQRGPHPRTVSEWRRFFDAHGYFVKGPTGKMFAVDLEPRAEDDNTLLRVYVKFVDPKLIGTKDTQHGSGMS
jgi:hypothetical protein